MAVLVAALFLLFSPLVTGTGILITNDILIADFVNHTYPVWHWAAQRMAAGDYLPLWMPEIYAGVFAPAVQVKLLYPPVYLALLLLPMGAAVTVLFCSHLLAAGYGCYRYLRLLGANFPASLIAGLSFMLSGFMVSHLKHVHMVFAAAYLPLLLLFVERFVATGKGRYLALLSVALGLLISGGHPEVVYQMLLLLVAYFLARYLPSRIKRGVGLRENLRRLARQTPLLLVALVLAAAASAHTTAPTAQARSLSTRSRGLTWEEATMFTNRPRDLLTMVSPDVRGRVHDNTYRGRSLYWESYAYCGIIPLAFGAWALLGLRRRRQRSARIFFGAALLVTSLLSLGSGTPLYYLFYHLVPGAENFRFPSRFLLLANFSLCALAALGLTLAWERLPRLRGNFAHVVGAALLAITLVDLALNHGPENFFARWNRFLAPPRSVKTIRSLEPGGQPFRVLSLRPVAAYRRAFRAGGWQDPEPYYQNNNFLSPNLGLVHAVHMVNAYVDLSPSYSSVMWGAVDRPPAIYGLGAKINERDQTVWVNRAFVRACQAFNVKYIVTSLRITVSPRGALTLVRAWRTGHFTAHVYRVNKVLPRAYLVHSVAYADDERSAAKTLMDQTSFDPQRSAVVLTRDRPKLGASLTSSRRRYTAPRRITDVGDARVEVLTESSASSLLVLTDSYHPQWKVSVDGEPRPVLQVNVSMRGVALGPGRHRVVFELDAGWYRWLVALSGAALAAQLVWLLVALRRKP